MAAARARKTPIDEYIGLYPPLRGNAKRRRRHMPAQRAILNFRWIGRFRTR
jgi:hypothetical protein